MPEITPLEFVSKWKRTTARERQTYQEHFIDICRLIRQQTPNEGDPHGTRYAFEMGAQKTSGGDGWADVAKLGYFGWEYKGKHANLDKAVFAAYGRSPDLTDEQIPEKLLALNLERAAKQ